MENIFKDAKLGDKFLTKDCRIAVYIGRFYDGDPFQLKYPIAVHVDGNRPDALLWYNDLGETEYVIGSNIVSSYQEPIDEDKLNKPNF